MWALIHIFAHDWIVYMGLQIAKKVMDVISIVWVNWRHFSKTGAVSLHQLNNWTGVFISSPKTPDIFCRRNTFEKWANTIVWCCLTVFSFFLHFRRCGVLALFFLRGLLKNKGEPIDSVSVSISNSDRFARDVQSLANTGRAMWMLLYIHRVSIVSF